MEKPKIYADFQNGDSQGRIRLNCIGSMEDLSQQQVALREGLALTLFSDDLNDKGQLDELLVDGIVSFSEIEHCWVASIDWKAIRHSSAQQSLRAKGNDYPPPSDTEPERPKQALQK